MNAVDSSAVHALFAAQREAYEAALADGQRARREHDQRTRGLADAAIEELKGERARLERDLEDARFLIARLLDAAGGTVVLSNFVWAFGLCPRPTIVEMPAGFGDSVVVSLRTDKGEPWPPRGDRPHA